MRRIAVLFSILFTVSAAYAQPVMVKDINPGSDGQVSLFGVIDDGQLYFGADNGTHGREPWVSDGRAAGTQMVLDMNSGSAASFPSFIGVDNSLIYFGADNGTEGRELWSIANAATPPTLHDIRPGPGNASPGWAGRLGAVLLVVATDGTDGRELFWVDNAGVPELWADINESPSLGSFPQSFLPVGLNSMLLTARPADIPPDIGSSPHRLTGRDYVEIKRSGDDRRLRPRSQYYQVGSSQLFFGFADTETGEVATGTELWRIGNGADNASLVKDINPGVASSFGANLTATVYNGELYFSAETAANGLEAWKSDGSEVGTKLLKDIGPGPDDSRPSVFIEYKNELYFGTYTGNGQQLWKTNGSEAGTVLVATIDTEPSSQAPLPLTVFDDYLLFRGDTLDSGVEWWAANGEIGGVQRVADINPGPGDGLPQFGRWLIDADTFLFSADDGEHGLELWRLDSGYLDTLFYNIFADGFECLGPACP